MPVPLAAPDPASPSGTVAERAQEYAQRLARGQHLASGGRPVTITIVHYDGRTEHLRAASVEWELASDPADDYPPEYTTILVEPPRFNLAIIDALATRLDPPPDPESNPTPVARAHAQTQAINEEFGWERPLEAGGSAQVWIADEPTVAQVEENVRRLAHDLAEYFDLSTADAAERIRRALEPG